MEIQGASCDEVNLDLKELLELSDLSGLSKDGNLLEKLHKSFNQQKWEELGEKMAEYLSPYQLERALRILRPLHVDSTEEDREKNSVI